MSDDPVIDVEPRTPRRVAVDGRFMLSHPAHLIALGFGSGLSPKAPGTFGTLWAWVAWLVLGAFLAPADWGWVIGLSLPVGWWACTVTARHAGIADPGFIVWDEVLAFWLILWVIAPSSWQMQLLAFVVFRYFDAAKPGPVRWADQVFKGGGWRGGFGIIFDDLVAAGCSLLVLALVERLLGGWAYA
ncbi:phosphatidylglycerophosphatase A family protein [Leptothrix discophora]